MKKLPIADFEIYSPEKKHKWETLEVALLLFTVSLIALGTLLIFGNILSLASGLN